MNYLQERLQLYGITDELNQTTIRTGVNDQDGNELPPTPAEWFTNDQNGNIKILFKTLDNRQLSLHTDSQQDQEEGRRTWAKKIYRTCLNPENRKRMKEETGKSVKYIQPKNTGSIIFHTQGVIDAYTTQTKVSTLYLVEGEFKAFVAWMHSKNWTPTKPQKRDEPNLPPEGIGLPIMGITGIRNMSDEDKDLHADIMNFIRVCQPDNVVFIMDADYRSISTKWDPVNTPDMDLGQRLKNFYHAVIDFRSMLKGRVSDLYLVNIREVYLSETIPGTQETVKGLDDVFAATDRRPEEVLFHLCKVIRPNTRNNIWFEALNVSTAVGTAIKKHFLLTYRKGAPAAFYEHHEAIIGEAEFRFNGCRYQVSEDGTVQMTVHGDSEQYYRVKGKYFKQITYPDAYGNMLRELVDWPTSEIKRDYVDQGYKNFFQSIPKYDRFVVVPQNNPEKYQQVIKNCFNLYYKIDIEPRPGKWPTIEMYLKHLFGARAKYRSTDQFMIALDWISIAWNKPTQKLPAICLVSEEKSTGKSIFLELMKAMFQDNGVIIGNQEITDRFNDDYITKNIIGLNESFIDKKSTIEKIKTWITERSAQMDTKNISRTRIDMFAKILMTSNNVTDFIRIDKDETRFWVRYIHPFEGEEIPNLLDQMIEELPAFVEYIRKDHKLSQPKSLTRLYFRPEVYATETLKQLQSEGDSQLYKNIYISIQEKFIEFNSAKDQITKFTRLYYTITQLCGFILGEGIKADKQYVAKVLKYEFKIPVYEVPKSRTMPQTDPTIEGGFIHGQAKPGRYYEFKIEDFFTPENLAEMGIQIGKEPIAEVEGDLPF